jgi:hypothetical protein
MGERRVARRRRFHRADNVSAKPFDGEFPVARLQAERLIHEEAPRAAA